MYTHYKEGGRWGFSRDRKKIQTSEVSFAKDDDYIVLISLEHFQLFLKRIVEKFVKKK